MKVHAKLIARLTLLAGLPLMLTGVLAAQTLTPTGAYGFLLSTRFTSPTNQGGGAILGVINFDGSGNVKGPFILEFGSGSPLPVETITGTFSGTYSTNADGSGSISMALSNGDSLNLAMVLDTSGRGLELVATGGSGGFDLSVTVLSGIGSKRSVTAPKGSYGYQFTYSPQPSGNVGTATFDGSGNVTMSQTFVSAGPNAGTATYTGTDSITASGIGTITLAAVAGQGAQTFVFVSTQGATELLLMQINRSGNGVAFATARLQ